MLPGLVVDLFAGGGGASTGLAQALGRDPDIAVNHDAEALSMHMEWRSLPGTSAACCGMRIGLKTGQIIQGKKYVNPKHDKNCG